MQTSQQQSSSFHKDLYSLARIVFAGLMASLTMLVVTVLLYEAVLADHATAVMTSHSGSYVSFPRDNTTTAPAPAPPPTALPYHHPPRAPDHAHRRKTFYRKNPKPFKPKRVKSDPYVFGDENDSQYQASDHQFHEQKPKSIQEIISYLTENRPSKMMQSGLKFSGSFNHPHDTRDGKSHDPVEDYRHSGDPAEVNSALLGYSAPTRSIPNHGKPMPVSLLLDIYPANDSLKKKSRRRPNYPPSRLLSRPQHMVDPGNSYPVAGPYRPDAMEPPVMRDHEMRPSSLHPSRRPYSHARRDRDPKHHQIRLQLNFYPKKKQNGLYARTPPNTRYGGIEDNKSILNKQNSPISVSTASSLWSPSGWSPSNWSPEDAVSSPAPASSTILGLQPIELATDESSGFGKRLIPANHRSPASRLQAASTTNASALYGVVGSHGYTYELPTRLYLDHDEPPPEPRNE